MQMAMVDFFNTNSDGCQILETGLFQELLNSCANLVKRWKQAGPIGMTSHLRSVGKEDSSGKFLTVSHGEIAK